MDDQVSNYMRPIFYLCCLFGMFPLNRPMTFKIFVAVLNLFWLSVWASAILVLSEEKNVTHNHILLIYYKLILSLSNFFVTGFQSIYHTRNLKNVLSVFSEMMDELKIILPKRRLMVLCILLYYPLHLIVLLRTHLGTSTYRIVLFSYIVKNLPELIIILPLLRFNYLLSVGNRILGATVDKVTTVEDAHSLRRLLVIHNKVAKELAIITTIHSKEILLFVANLFFITNEGVYWFLVQRNRLDLKTVSLALKLLYVYVSLELIIGPCDAANILNHNFNKEVTKFALKSAKVDQKDIKYYFSLRKQFKFSANNCFGLDESLIKMIITSVITTQLILMQLTHTTPS